MKKFKVYYMYKSDDKEDGILHLNDKSYERIIQKQLHKPSWVVTNNIEIDHITISKHNNMKFYFKYGK